MNEPDTNKPSVAVQPPPPPPPVIIQPTANPVVVAGNVVDALKAQPLLLVVVLLNVIMVAGAAYYLLRVEEYRHAERQEILKLLQPIIEQRQPPGAVRSPVRPESRTNGP